MEARHIQDYNTAQGFEPHWGYHDRVVPCTNDAGSCEYLWFVYHQHDLGMLYTGIMYAALGGILLLWCLWNHSSSRPNRITRTVSTFVRRYTAREVRRLRFLFGRTTRLQLLLLAGLTTYLTICTFVGIEYRKWKTPVKNMPGVYNIRTGLGMFADRVGIFAYALTPFSILLSSRESLLSAVTGIPYQHFNFLHRWIGHIILLQSIVHTIGWCVVEIRLYQPQPTVAKNWITQWYMIWGTVALILLLILWGLALPVSQRLFGYEFFRKAHWVLAMVYIGACWAHWVELKCFMIPSLFLWVGDRGVRLIRSALIHYRFLSSGHGEFTAFDAKITHFETDVIRLDIDFPSAFSWKIGQHYFLTFTKGSIWQSHPFTPLSLPGTSQGYLIRARRGETKRVAQFDGDSTPVILTGAYGVDITQGLAPTTNVLCVAGGTGITFVLPVLLLLAQREPLAHVQLVWVIRHAVDTEWIQHELAQLVACPHISVVVHSTRDKGPKDTPSESPDIETASDEQRGALKEMQPVLPHRPDLHATVGAFLQRAAGPSRVYVSGPCGMITDVRDKVAASNDASKVWRGEDEFDVEVVYDDRLE